MIEMPHAPRSPSNCGRTQTKLSAWTPLNHPLANSKVFEERRTLLAKWFDRWSDSQRRAVLHDFVQSCSPQQLRFLSVSVSRQLPLLAADFTCMLPRALCLYLFSFLDPRSLCRCAQVSWHWKSIVELDQVWMPKCLRLGWCITFSPSPFEQGVWKRHYIQTVQELRLTRLQTATRQQQFVIPEVTTISSRPEDPSEPSSLTQEHLLSTTQQAGSSLKSGLLKDKEPTALPPWKDSDRHPKDTRRFNYLDNLAPTGPPLKAQVKSTGTSCHGDTLKGSKKSPSEATYRLRKAKSLMLLSANCRPQYPPPPQQTETLPLWASGVNYHPINKEAAAGLLHLAQWNAGVRPGPTRSAVPGLSAEVLRACQRSHRSSPSKPLFGVQPWNLPAPGTQ